MHAYVTTILKRIPSPQFLLKDWAQAEKNVPSNLTALAEVINSCLKSALTHGLGLSHVLYGEFEQKGSEKVVR